MKWFVASIIIWITILVIGPQVASAFDIADSFFGSGTKHTTLDTIYNPIIRLVYIVGGLMVLVSFLYGGFKIIQGTAKDLEEGRNIIFYTFLGVILLVSVYWITSIAGMILGTNPQSGSVGPPVPTPTPTPTPTSSLFSNPYGSPCTSHNQCRSNYCNSTTNQCNYPSPAQQATTQLRIIGASPTSPNNYNLTIGSNATLEYSSYYATLCELSIGTALPIEVPPNGTFTTNFLVASRQLINFICYPIGASFDMSETQLYINY